MNSVMMMMMMMMTIVVAITTGMTDWHKMMTVKMIMTVNRQAIHSFDLYNGRDNKKKVVVPAFVTKMLTH